MQPVINNEKNLFTPDMTELKRKEFKEQAYKYSSVTFKVIALASGLIGVAAIGATVYMPAFAFVALPVAAISFVLSAVSLGAMVYSVKKYNDACNCVTAEKDKAAAFDPSRNEDKGL